MGKLLSAKRLAVEGDVFADVASLSEATADCQSGQPALNEEAVEFVEVSSPPRIWGAA
jgi:hypothetical protein